MSVIQITFGYRAVNSRRTTSGIVSSLAGLCLCRRFLSDTPSLLHCSIRRLVRMSSSSRVDSTVQVFTLQGKEALSYTRYEVHTYAYSRARVSHKKMSVKVLKLALK